MTTITEIHGELDYLNEGDFITIDGSARDGVYYVRKVVDQTMTIRTITIGFVRWWHRVLMWNPCNDDKLIWEAE